MAGASPRPNAPPPPPPGPELGGGYLVDEGFDDGGVDAHRDVAAGSFLGLVSDGSELSDRRRVRPTHRGLERRVSHVHKDEPSTPSRSPATANERMSRASQRLAETSAAPSTPP